MRKVDNGEKEKKKIMSLIVATNVVASRPPIHRPTGTLHTCANIFFKNGDDDFPINLLLMVDMYIKSDSNLVFQLVELVMSFNFESNIFKNHIYLFESN